MALWSRLHISPFTWKALCHRRNSKKTAPPSTSPPSSPPEPLNTRMNSTAASTCSQSARLALTTTGRNTAVYTTGSSPVSCSSSDNTSILPASSSPHATHASSSPPSNQTSGDHQHILFTAPSTTTTNTAIAQSNHLAHALPNRITTFTRQALSQHDYLQTPLRQLIHACQSPPYTPQEDRYPALDPTIIAGGMHDLHLDLLRTHLDITTKLSLLGMTLRPLLLDFLKSRNNDSSSSRSRSRSRNSNITRETLARIKREVELAERRNRRLRRHEEDVKRFLRWLRAGKGVGDYNCCRGAGAGGGDVGGRRAAIEMARVRFMPFWREAIAELNLAGGRMAILAVELARLEERLRRRENIKGGRGVEVGEGTRGENSKRKGALLRFDRVRSPGT